MAKILIGYMEMKKKKGKVLFFGEKRNGVVGLSINDEPRYCKGFVYDDDADAITEDDIGKEFKFRSGFDRV